MGEVRIIKNPSIENTNEFEAALKEIGFELFENKKTQLVEKIKTAIIEMIHCDEELP